MRIIYIFFLALLIPLAGHSQTTNEHPVTEPASEIRVEPFESDNGWGYDIYVNDKKYIHQTTIPSVPGTSGFSSEKDALKVGELVKGKVQRNEMPPSVTPEEIDSLGIALPKSTQMK